MLSKELGYSVCGRSTSELLCLAGAIGTEELDNMKTALYLLGFQGLIGAFDTLFYHEWKARLPARGRRAAPELALHAARDFLYGVLFCTLPWLAWKGAWTIVLLVVIAAEIILTLWDFVVEIAVRRDLGDVYAGSNGGQSRSHTHLLVGKPNRSYYSAR